MQQDNKQQVQVQPQPAQSSEKNQFQELLKAIAHRHHYKILYENTIEQLKHKQQQIKKKQIQQQIIKQKQFQILKLNQLLKRKGQYQNIKINQEIQKLTKLLKQKDKTIDSSKIQIEKLQNKINILDRNIVTLNTHLAKTQNSIKNSIQTSKKKINQLENEFLQLSVQFMNVKQSYESILIDVNQKSQILNDIRNQSNQYKQLYQRIKSQNQQLINQILIIKLKENQYKKVQCQHNCKQQNMQMDQLMDIQIYEMFQRMKFQQEQLTKNWNYVSQKFNYQYDVFQMNKKIEKLVDRCNQLQQKNHELQNKNRDYIIKYDKQGYQDLLLHQKPDLIKYFIHKKQQFDKFVECLTKIQTKVDQIVSKLLNNTAEQKDHEDDEQQDQQNIENQQEVLKYSNNNIIQTLNIRIKQVQIQNKNLQNQITGIKEQLYNSLQNSRKLDIQLQTINSDITYFQSQRDIFKQQCFQSKTLVQKIKDIYVRQITQLIDQFAKEFQELSKIKKKRPNNSNNPSSNTFIFKGKSARCCHCLTYLKYLDRVCKQCGNYQHNQCMGGSASDYFNFCYKIQRVD